MKAFCSICENEINFSSLSRSTKCKVRKGHRILCKNQECRRKLSSRTMGATNHKYASARMKANNPMFRDECREKMQDTLLNIGWKPPIQGGNGKPPSVSERLLAEALHLPLNVIVNTGKTKDSGYPSHYKLDIGDINTKVGVELDGRSHGLRARQSEDRKKEKFLTSLGWKIIRFKNEEVLSNINLCVTKATKVINDRQTLSN